VLLHGDLGWDNIIVRVGSDLRVVAFIDFEHSMLGAAEYDFVKSSVASGERAAAFTTALTTNYLRAGGWARTLDEFQDDVTRAEVVADLSVALDLSRGPFRDVYAIATTEHRAWQQAARLYRTLAMGRAESADVPETFGVRRTLELARQSTCRVRKVGAVILDVRNEEIANGLNNLRSTDSQCWCISGNLGHNRPRCPARHAEANAITSADARGIPLHGCTIVSSTCPCLACARHIVQAGLRAVLYIDDYIDTKGLDYLLASGVLTRRVDI
jgi:dCMP deaminase